MQMVEKYLWELHGCKPQPPTDEECKIERQRLVSAQRDQADECAL